MQNITLYLNICTIFISRYLTYVIFTSFTAKKYRQLGGWAVGGIFVLLNKSVIKNTSRISVFLNSQFPHDFHKLIQCICAIYAEIAVLEHHEVAIILPALRLPFAAESQFAFAVAVVPIIPLVLD